MMTAGNSAREEKENTSPKKVYLLKKINGILSKKISTKFLRSRRDEIHNKRTEFLQLSIDRGSFRSYETSMYMLLILQSIEDKI